jgi:hypothetical protein
MTQVHFVGGPWDGMTFPCASRVPERILMPCLPHEARPQASESPSYCYALDNDDGRRCFRFIGRSDREPTPPRPALPSA